MENLSMCRICLATDAPMSSIASHLRDMYEKISSMTFKREDRRPLVACYICHARLQNCYRLRTSCLRSEELLTEMLTSGVLKPQDVCSTNSFSVVSAVHISIGCELQESTESHVKEEAAEIIYDAELNQQYTKDKVMEAPAKHRRHSEDPLDIIKREPTVEILSGFVDSADGWGISGFDADFWYVSGPTGLFMDKDTEYIKVEVQNVTTEEKCWKPVVAGSSSQSAVVEKMDRNDTRIGTSDLKNRRLPTQKISTDTTSNKINRNKQIKGEVVVTESIDNNIVVHEGKGVRDEAHKLRNKSDICSKKKNEKFTKRSKRTHTGETRFQCNACNKKFNHKTSYEIHTRTHTGEKPYMCDVCTKCFIGRNALTIHLRTHTGEKPYTCNVCKKCFSTNTAMKKHIRIHTGDKPYMCNICKKCFIQKTSLDCHIRAHTGDKPYTCKICNKCFKQRSQLDHHIRTHTGDKPFCCNVCKKRFTKKITLKEHTRIHTGEKPYMCDVCQKDFVRKSALTIHIRTHTGDKPYMCHMCNKCFRSRSTLTDHIRTHTGEKPFSCDVCKKCFTKKATLTGHMRLHTEKKP